MIGTLRAGQAKFIIDAGGAGRQAEGALGASLKGELIWKLAEGA